MSPLDITATRSLPPLTCDNDVFSDSFTSRMDELFTPEYIETGKNTRYVTDIKGWRKKSASIKLLI